MEEMFRGLVLYVLPIAEIVITIIIGIRIVDRSKESKSQAKRFIGKSLIVTAMLSIIALIWLVYEYSQTYSWGKLIIGMAPIIPLGVISVGTILALSIYTIWNNLIRKFSNQEDIITKQEKFKIWLSTIILSTSILYVLWALLPYIYLLPYRTLSFGGGYFDGESTMQLRLYGIKYFSENHEELITLKNLSWPKYSPSFNVKLNKFTTIELNVRRNMTNTLPEEVKTYYLPIEKSVYHLVNGIPVKINNVEFIKSKHNQRIHRISPKIYADA